MPTEPQPPTLADALRDAVRDSGLSYQELARRAGADQGTISRFMLGQRDLTLAVASRLCLVLGMGLTRVGTVQSEPLEAPPPSNRRRPKKRPPPASAVRRGRGRRVDLETKEEPVSNEPGKVRAAVQAGDSAPASGGPTESRRNRKKA